MAFAIASDSKAGKSFTLAQPFYVHDIVSRKLPAWKTPMYHLHNRFYRRCDFDMLQWIRELPLLLRMFYVAISWAGMASSFSKLLLQKSFLSIRQWRFLAVNSKRRKGVQDIKNSWKKPYYWSPIVFK